MVQGEIYPHFRRYIYMAKVRLAKLDNAYVRKWQRQNRERAVDIREQTLRAVREGTSLSPAITTQQEFMVSGLSRVFHELCKPSIVLLEQKSLALLSGSYARGTCVVGSDLDLDFFYPETERRSFYPFEKEIIQVISQLYDFPNGGIHSHLAFVGRRTPVKGKDFLKPYILERLLIQWASKLRLKILRKNETLGMKIFFLLRPFINKYAFRDFAPVMDICLQKALNKSKLIRLRNVDSLRPIHSPHFDSAINIEFVFGNEDGYASFLAKRETVFEELKREAVLLSSLCKILKSTVLFSLQRLRTTKPINDLDNVKDLNSYIRDESLIHYYYLKALEKGLGFSFLAGTETAVINAVETLLKIKAAMNIERDPMPHIATTFEGKTPLSDALLHRTATHIGCSSVKGLRDLIQQEMITILEIVEAAYTRFQENLSTPSLPL